MSGDERSTTSEIAGTADGPLYQTWRQGPVGYRIDLPEGRYRTAFKRRYIVGNDKDHIVISLRPVKGKPAIAALKVRKL